MTRTPWPLLSMATLAGLALTASLPQAAQAQVTTYTGEDLNAGPLQTHPNASAAAAQFDAAASALGTESIVTFESAPVGSITTLTVAPGVTLTGTDYQGNPQTIQNSPSFPTNSALGGYNTTPGGANYLNILGGTAVFTFATPIQAFGAYISGVQTNFYQDTVLFSDGTSQTVTVPGAGTTNFNGALDFVGFTDPGKTISQITINAGNTVDGADEIGLDDVRFVALAAAPEPSSLAAFAVGLLTLSALAVKAKKRTA